MTNVDEHYARIGKPRPPPDRSWAKLTGEAKDAAGETYAWCQGCDQTPNQRLMGWTELGLYRCRVCRGVDRRDG